MFIGEKIKSVRKQRGMTLGELGEAIGLGISTLSGYENCQKKGQIDPATLCKIADTLNDLSILTDHCSACPIKQAVFLRLFPDLNNIRREPAIIAGKLRKEMSEAIEALDRLTERFSAVDFKNQPDYREAFGREYEQVIDVQRCIEIMGWELIMSGACHVQDMRDVVAKQQDKCIRHGHHKEMAEAR